MVTSQEDTLSPRLPAGAENPSLSGKLVLGRYEKAIIIDLLEMNYCDVNNLKLSEVFCS